MPKVAIIGKQQPLKVRQMIKEYLEENGHAADILYMDTCEDNSLETGRYIR